ncbi:C-type lectin domain-containing protein 91 [Trichostrongylus colubriformis]|uniref:C-type lectin domain-containing protein 91 n=1 Tax=Trichostrongylus colubriformis TaxID=6319 RepID=A0AAN8FT44_TRICO
MLTKYIFALAALTSVLSYSHRRVYQTRPKTSPHLLHPHPKCASGWFAYRDSCYFIERQKMRFDAAEVKCLESDSTMFVADDMEEWTNVMSHTPMNELTWTGLEQPDDERMPLWKEPGGMNPRKIDWLVQPGDSVSNGWSTASNCVAHFHSTYKSYSFFYNCGIDFYSICEKNSTLLTKIWDNTAPGFRKTLHASRYRILL